MPDLTFHGHSCFTLTADDGTVLLIDPFLSGNPTADIGPDELDRVDYILVSHGHADHLGDTFGIAKRTGATIVGIFELATYAQEVKGIENVHPLSIGGGYDFPFGRVKMTPALHGDSLDEDETGRFTTVPGGYLITVDGKTIYHAGDTALIADMQFLKGQVDVACLPIGDNFTMGPEDAVRAIELIEPDTVIPMHYNTFDLIRQDPRAFAEKVGGRARVVVLEPGETHGV